LFEALHIRNPVSPFAQAVLAERRRQIEVEGWDSPHDDEHQRGELARAGGCYALKAHMHYTDPVGYVADPRAFMPNQWPWESEWWKPQGFRRDLVKAGALILAEGEKCDRSRRRPI
jgi:hypothetical protein